MRVHQSGHRAERVDSSVGASGTTRRRVVEGSGKMTSVLRRRRHGGRKGCVSGVSGKGGGTRSRKERRHQSKMDVKTRVVLVGEDDLREGVESRLQFKVKGRVFECLSTRRIISSRGNVKKVVNKIRKTRGELKFEYFDFRLEQCKWWSSRTVRPSGVSKVSLTYSLTVHSLTTHPLTWSLSLCDLSNMGPSPDLN